MCSFFDVFIRIFGNYKMKQMEFSREKWERVVAICEADPRLIDETPPLTDDLELNKSLLKVRRLPKSVRFKPEC